MHVYVTFAFDYTAVAVSGKVGIPYTGLNTPVGGGGVIGTHTDRPKSACNRCVIEVLVAFLCCHVGFWIFLSV